MSPPAPPPEGTVAAAAALEWTQVQVETAQIMITIQGCSLATVALAIGKSRSAVAAFVHRRGWQAPASKARQPKARPTAASEVSIRTAARRATASREDRDNPATAACPILPKGLFVFTGMAGLSRRARAGRAVLDGEAAGTGGTTPTEGS